MSRPSNKTAHVLGLITAGKKNQEPDPAASEEKPEVLRAEETAPAAIEEVAGEEEIQQEQERPDPADPAKDQQKLIEEAGATPSEEDPTSKSFSHVMPKFNKSTGKAPIVEILFNDHDPLSDLIRDQLEAGEAMEEATKKETSAMSEENKNLKEHASDGCHGTLITKDPATNKVSIKEQDSDENIELDYKFLNVSEELVREKVLEVMNSVGTCTCDRCIVDTIALSITNLPAKCIVADKDAIFPLLSYYRSKFATSVHTELMKAALLVKDNPHH